MISAARPPRTRIPSARSHGQMCRSGGGSGPSGSGGGTSGGATSVGQGGGGGASGGGGGGPGSTLSVSTRPDAFTSAGHAEALTESEPRRIMANELNGKRVAIVATDMVEQVELLEPRKALDEAGAQTELISLEPGKIQGFNHYDKGDEIPVDRTITSWPSIQTDIRNAGGNWVDEEVHVDQGLVTSRKPDDIPAFNAKMIEEFAEGKHAEQREKTLHAEATPS